MSNCTFPNCMPDCGCIIWHPERIWEDKSAHTTTYATYMAGRCGECWVGRYKYCVFASEGASSDTVQQDGLLEHTYNAKEAALFGAFWALRKAVAALPVAPESLKKQLNIEALKLLDETSISCLGNSND